MRAAREGKTHTKALCGSLASLALRTNKHQIKRINWSSASASSCRPAHLSVKLMVRGLYKTGYFFPSFFKQLYTN